MNKDQLEIFLKSFASESSITFLETSKDKKEIERVAEKASIQLPNNDLALFKAIYLVTDKVNGNNSLLPKEEVEKALNTIPSKIVDLNHDRNVVRGHLLFGELEENKVIVWGVFYKSSFPKDYNAIKKLFDEGKLTVSMECWCTKEKQKDGSYVLNDITFAGVGLLWKGQKPAEEEAVALEFSSEEEKQFVLELATVKDIKEFVHLRNKKMEIARFYQFDFENIMRLTDEVVCNDCKSKDSEKEFTWWIIEAVSFKHGLVHATCFDCRSEYIISVTPQVIMEMPKEEEYSSTRKIKGIDKFSHDLWFNKIKNTSKTEDDVQMEKELAELKTKLEALEASSKTKEVEIATLKETISKLEGELEASKKSLEEAKVAWEAEKVEIAKKAVEEERATVEKANKIASRKSELEEFAKDMSDEDILNDDKFENAKLKKELATLKKTPVVAGRKQVVLEAGAKETVDAIKDLSTRVTERAFGSASTEDEE